MDIMPWKRVFITGGSSGIGFAVAEKAAEGGADIVLLARRGDKLEEAAEKLRKNYGSAVRTVSIDIRNRSEVEKSLSEQVLAHGAPDLLVNSAGTAYPDYFERIPYEKFRDSMEINLTGTWNVTQTLVGSMGAGSHIVNVASIAGFLGLFGYTAYSASKFAVVGFSESLRNELAGRGIGVSVLCPPDTQTPQLEKEERTKPPETKALSGAARAMSPERVAQELFTRLGNKNETPGGIKKARKRRGVRGIKRKRPFIIVPGFEGKMIYWLKRVWPGLIYRILDREVRKSEKRKSV